MVNTLQRDWDALSEKIGYCFSDRSLLQQALTHPSASRLNYERLEFLGDAVLNAVISAQLYRTCMQANEGEMTIRRSQLVDTRSLVKITRTLGLPDYIIIAASEDLSNDRRLRALYSDVLEALVGAICLDGGYVAAERCLTAWFADLLASSVAAPLQKDAKTRLQEYCQKKQWPLPTYTLVEVQGPAHAQIFRMQCEVEGHAQQTTGQGGARRVAEQEAAAAYLHALEAAD